MGGCWLSVVYWAMVCVSFTFFASAFAAVLTFSSGIDKFGFGWNILSNLGQHDSSMSISLSQNNGLALTVEESILFTICIY
jgi:hypothetical protein